MFKTILRSLLEKVLRVKQRTSCKRVEKYTVLTVANPSQSECATGSQQISSSKRASSNHEDHPPKEIQPLAKKK